MDNKKTYLKYLFWAAIGIAALVLLILTNK